MARTILAILILAVSVNPAAEAGTSARGARVVRNLHGEYSSAKAMELLFGNFNPPDQDSRWEELSAPREFPKFHSVTEGIARLIYDVPFIQNGTPKHVLVTATTPSDQKNDCHACSVLLSAAVFSKTNDVWSLTAKQMYLADLGEFGEAPAVTLITLSTNDFGLLVTEQSSGSGFGEWTYVFSIEEKMPQLLMAETGAHFDMLKPCTERQWTYCAEYTGGISVAPSKFPNHYDILLVRTVTSTTSPGIHKGEYVTRFQFVNGRYVEENSQSR